MLPKIPDHIDTITQKPPHFVRVHGRRIGHPKKALDRLMLDRIEGLDEQRLP